MSRSHDEQDETISPKPTLREIARTQNALTQIQTIPRDGDPRSYYHHWLAALEIILEHKNAVSANDCLIRIKQWDEATRATLHGQPITLEKPRMAKQSCKCCGTCKLEFSQVTPHLKQNPQICRNPT